MRRVLPPLLALAAIACAGLTAGLPLRAAQALPAPADHAAALAQPAASAASDTAGADASGQKIVTITLTNLNQIVGIIQDKGKDFLTIKTAEGVMMLATDKVLTIQPGGKMETSPDAPAAADAGAAGADALAGPGAADDTGKKKGKAAANVPLSKMTPKERIKAAKALLAASNKAAYTYRQAMDKHTGGTPVGQTPTSRPNGTNGTNGTNGSNGSNGSNGANAGSGTNSNWQPFSSDNPQAKTTTSHPNPNNGTTNNNSPYNNAYNNPAVQNYLNRYNIPPTAPAP
ncbi:MAG: hypothetical protein ACREJ2_15135 [Planctomycetota bacterium]